MEVAGQQVAYPALDQIVDINRRIIERSGGSFFPPKNLKNENSLAYILAAIREPLMERVLYPTMLHKAAALCYTIVASHVFWDGCKRTGLFMAWYFLQSNSVDLRLDETAETVVLRIAQGLGTQEELLTWLREYVRRP